MFLNSLGTIGATLVGYKLPNMPPGFTRPSGFLSLFTARILGMPLGKSFNGLPILQGILLPVKVVIIPIGHVVTPIQ